MSKLKVQFNDVAYVLGYFVSIVIIGLLSWFSVEFRLDYLYSPEFIYNIVMTNLAYIITLKSTIEWSKRRAERKSKRLNQLKSDVMYAFDVYISDADFADYLLKINKAKKIAAWKKKIRLLLNKLNEKVSYNDSVKWNTSTEQQHSKNRYCRLRTKYEMWLSEEWCNQNIDGSRVDYEHLTVSNFYGVSHSNDSDRDFTRGSIQEIKDNAPNYMLGIAFVIFVSSFANPAFYVLSPSVIINTLAKLGGMINQIASGNSYGKHYTHTYTMSDWQKRKGYIENYLIEKKIPLNSPPFPPVKDEEEL